jgi:hypothetical protein
MDVYRRLVNRDLPREERACTSKIPFETRIEARAHARDDRRTDGSLRPYRCPFRDHWHVGHKRRRPPTTSSVGHAAPESPRDTGWSLDWLWRDWWEDRRRRHLRPPRLDRPWREAWAP